MVFLFMIHRHRPALSFAASGQAGSSKRHIIMAAFVYGDRDVVPREGARHAGPRKEARNVPRKILSWQWLGAVAVSIVRRGWTWGGE